MTVTFYCHETGRTITVTLFRDYPELREDGLVTMTDDQGGIYVRNLDATDSADEGRG